MIQNSTFYFDFRAARDVQALCGRALGARERYLTKPVPYDGLSAMVWQLIAKARVSGD